ncbi:MAG: cyclic nucleotide-binding domain-containing protein [Archangium sp.]|nr:cyclic nucleotide-binding domain-containing protein [Archangium sp.]
MELELTGFGEFEGVELLQKLHLFQKLTFDETKNLGSIIQYLDVPPGTIVIEQNALGDALYVIAKGEVIVSRDADGDGKHEKNEELGRLRDGELFGEMSLIDDVLTSARITTAVECRLLKMPRSDFEKMLSTDDKLAVKVYRSFIRTMAERLRKVNAQLSKAQAFQR